MPNRHLLAIDRVFRYASPPGCYHQPRRIRDGYEEIEVIIGGHGLFTMPNGEAVDAAPGSMLWYHAGEIVEVTSDPHDPYDCIVFEFLVEHAAEVCVPRHTRWGDTAQCIAFCMRAYDLFHSSEIDQPLFTSYHHLRLLWEAKQSLSEAPDAAMPTALRRALAFMNQHRAEAITTEMIAEEAGVSLSHLHGLFRKHLHATPMQAVLQDRIATAKGLLVSSTLSVKEISFRVGFQNVAHFCRSFKQRVGNTPMEYRRRFVYPAG